jgi:25S rRNA (uracil2843-N3)-methyltransferase
MSSKKKQQTQTKANHKASSEPQIDAAPAAPSAVPHLPVELQQAILDVFANALQLAADVDLFTTIQQVKGHLFNRDFQSAFGTEDRRIAYALRWSATRALAYAEVFSGLDPHCLAHQYPLGPTKLPKVVCLGGGAGAELVALAAATRHISLPGLDFHAVDIADWSSVLHQLHVSTEQRPPLSPYANASSKAQKSMPLLEAGQLQLQFDRHDVLEYSSAEDASNLQVMLAGVCLVTIMFTLNELFTSSVAKTTALLLGLTDAMEPGSWLLVVDSPGSYSEVTIGGAQKRYPMQWLLKHTLLEVAGTTDDRKWTQHLTDDSRWFRVNPKLKYRLDLENMRYQIHLFQRSEVVT